MAWARAAASGLLAASLMVVAISTNEPNVWPRPQKTTWPGGVPYSKRALVDVDTFQILHDLDLSVAQQALETAIDLHMKLFPRKVPYVPYDGWMKQHENHIESLKDGEHSSLPVLKSLQVVIEYPDVPLQLAEAGSEAHTLVIAMNGDEVVGTLTSFTVWGALQGLWTFQQLVTAHENSLDPEGHTLAVPLIVIDDFPRFQWRGFLVDTSRHFLAVGTIKRVVDALAMNKLNVLHWHLVDSHSFPIEISAFPDLAKKGSWGSFYNNGTQSNPKMPRFTYTREDVIEVVKYAALRGIRVMPEMDTPSHVTAWGKALPDFIACPDLHFAAHALDPRHEKNFLAVEKVMQEVGDLFPDVYFHLGADEMNMDCWGYKGTGGVEVKEHATKMGITLDKLLGNWVERVVPVAERMGKEPVLYADAFMRGVKMPATSILQVWVVGNAVEMIKKIASSGHRTIFSAGWYLDMQVPSLDKKQRYNYEDTWRDFYNNDPVADAKLTPAEAAQVLGGEICMWGEAVDATNIFTKSFPRASAAAERLWSTPGCGYECRDGDEVLIRLARFRCLMVLVGIQAGPIAPDYCPYVYMPSVLGDPNAPPAPAAAESDAKAFEHTYVGEQAAFAVDRVEHALGIDEADGGRGSVALVGIVMLPLVGMTMLLVWRSRRQASTKSQ